MNTSSTSLTARTDAIQQAQKKLFEGLDQLDLSIVKDAMSLGALLHEPLNDPFLKPMSEQETVCFDLYRQLPAVYLMSSGFIFLNDPQRTFHASFLALADFIFDHPQSPSIDTLVREGDLLLHALSSPESMELLLRKGANPNYCHDNGLPVLLEFARDEHHEYIAKQEHFTRSVLQLVQAGANLDYEHEGKTILEYGLDNDNDLVRKAFEGAFALHEALKLSRHLSGTCDKTKTSFPTSTSARLKL